MNTLNRSMLTGFTFALMAFAGISQAQTNDNWSSSTGSVRAGSDPSLCWRDNFWTPASANQDCDGALKPVPKAATAAPAAPVVAAPVASSSKVTLLADALFDFDKSTLKPEGTQKLDGLVSKLKNVTVEVIIVVGFTDSVGSLAYNKGLSLRRAEAVKAYLVKNGVEASRVYTEGKAFAEPVGDNKTSIGRALNRRSVIEVVGTAKK
jgi:OOP family OmpA-OmpF porin